MEGRLVQESGGFRFEAIDRAANTREGLEVLTFAAESHWFRA